MEKKYCIYCGAQNTTEAKFCVRCGKDLNPKENQLVDFLLKRTKDKFKGTAEDSVYEALKNFLLSHLYGTALTISFISALAVTAFAGNSYITEMNSSEMEVYLATIGGSYEENTDNQGAYPDEYNTAVHNMITSYEFQVFNESLRDAQGNIMTTNPDSMRLPASYGYGGEHQLGPHIPTYIDGASQSGTKHRTEFDPDLFQTDVARRLANDGYTVGECVVDTRFEDSDGGIVASYSYIVAAVMVNDEWLVAEDRILLAENIDLSRNGENSQQTGDLPEITDVDTNEVYPVVDEFYDLVTEGKDGSHLMVGADFGYAVQHQLAADPELPVGVSGTDRSTYYGPVLDPDDFINPVSMQLYNDGYTVIEYKAQQTVYKLADERTAIGEREHRITCVKTDGRWYIAEDTLVSRNVYGNSSVEETAIDESAVYDAATYYTTIVFGGGNALPEDLGYNVQSQLDYTRNTPFHPSEDTETETRHKIITAADEFNNPVSPVLYNDGYTVAEFVATQTVYDINNDYRIIAERTYCITCVEIDGQWLIAEDTILSSTVY